MELEHGGNVKLVVTLGIWRGILLGSFEILLVRGDFDWAPGPRPKAFLSVEQVQTRWDPKEEISFPVIMTEWIQLNIF